MTDRKLPCDPVAGARAAEPVRLRRGGVEFVAPAGVYAGLPAWRTRASWLVALRTHPRLVEACAGVHVRPGTALRVLAELARHGEPDTGRGIAVPHRVIAESLGLCTKTVQRSVRVAYSLGALHLVLAGTQMSIGQRACVLDVYGRGVPSRRWRELPNFYAAVMPAEAVARVRAVDNPRPPRCVCPPSGTGRPAGTDSSRTCGESSFTDGCGRRAGPSPGRKGMKDAPAARQLEERSARRGGPVLSPELEAYAAALCARLPGYQRISLRRIGPALSRYLSAGLSPADLTAGLDAYCRSRGIAWITAWTAGSDAEQARYLTGMLTHARRAGHIRPGRR